jgi:hypothetical protein
MKQPRNKRTLTADELKLIAISLEMAAEKFKGDAYVAPTGSIAQDHMRQAIEIERLAMALAAADSIVLEMK